MICSNSSSFYKLFIPGACLSKVPFLTFFNFSGPKPKFQIKNQRVVDVWELGPSGLIQILSKPCLTLSVVKFLLFKQG